MSVRRVRQYYTEFLDPGGLKSAQIGVPRGVYKKATEKYMANTAIDT